MTWLTSTGLRMAGGCALAALVVVACGGIAVIDAGGGGAGTGGASSSDSSSSVSSSASGPSGCMDHSDCGFDEVCIFGSGQCAPSCQGTCDPCGPGSVCNGCATASCPACADCVAACVPIQAGQCDPDDACNGPNEICVWELSFCAQTCAPNGSCPGGTSCVGCATGSCCGCEDCVDACL